MLLLSKYNVLPLLFDPDMFAGCLLPPDMDNARYINTSAYGAINALCSVICSENAFSAPERSG